VDDRCELTRGDQLWFDSTIEQQEDATGIQAALEHLSSEQREVIVLKIWGELTFAQIAQTLGESINTVSSRYRYALGALRRHMNPQEYERV
jgi:RNA polymerase sigma-70 factor (ECF subfamily)